MGDLSGTVTLTGSPVSGALVWVIDTTNDTVVGTDTTDVNGDWAVTGLPGGDERYHALVQYDDGGQQYNALSLPYLSTPATLSPATTDAQFATPTATIDFGIPDSVVAQYNAQQLTGFSDGQTVSTRPDQVGTLDLSGNATFRPSGINGFQSVEYDGVDDEHSADGGQIAQKYVIYAVIDPDFADTTTERHTIVSSEGGSQTNVEWADSSGTWAIFAGTELTGSATVNRSLITAVFDGTNSVIREDGTQTASGDAGTNALDLLGVGYYSQGPGRYWPGDIGFVEVHDGDVSNGLTTREQEIADQWGITI